MKIYVVSDTHNSFSFAPFLKIAQNADMVIHCGDGSRDFEDLKHTLDCSVYGVRGNCDFSGKREEIIEIEDHRIFVSHGDIYNVKHSLSGLLIKARENNCDIVLYGHTHIPDISYYENVWFINPGSLTRPRDNKKQTYCILEITDKINANLVEYKGEY